MARHCKMSPAEGSREGRKGHGIEVGTYVMILILIIIFVTMKQTTSLRPSINAVRVVIVMLQLLYLFVHTCDWDRQVFVSVVSQDNI